MRFTAAAVLAFASAVVAQTAGFDVFSKPTQGEEIPAGSNYEIEWQPSSDYTGTVTITLLGGIAPNKLDDIAVVAS